MHNQHWSFEEFKALFQDSFDSQEELVTEYNSFLQTFEQLDKAFIHQRVHRALEEMSVNQRTALVLRYFEDMPIAEIAQTLGCTEGTVRTHIRRSLLALRAKLAGKIDI